MHYPFLKCVSTKNGIALMTIALALTCLTSSINAAEPIRQWTDSTGKFSRSGQFRSLQNGQVAIWNAVGQKVIELPLARLSTTDLNYLANRPDLSQSVLARLSTKYYLIGGTKLTERTGRETILRGKVDTRIAETIVHLEIAKLKVVQVEGPADVFDSASKKVTWHAVPLPTKSDSEMTRYQLITPVTADALPGVVQQQPRLILAILSKLDTANLLPEIDAIPDAQPTLRKGLTPNQFNRRNAIQRELADLRKRRRTAEKQVDFLTGERGRQRNRDKVNDLNIAGVKAKNEVRDLDRRILALEAELKKLAPQQ